MGKDYVTSSGLLSADAAVATQSGLLYGVALVPAAADASVILYDNASAASGTVLVKLTVLANQKSEETLFNQPIAFQNGIYADVTGAGAAYIVYYITS